MAGCAPCGSAAPGIALQWLWESGFVNAPEDRRRDRQKPAEE
jgi:hypothetical protein